MSAKQAANIKSVQRVNRTRVANVIRNHGGISRVAIIERTGLSPASVTNIVSYLMGIRLVTESGMEHADRIGRKSMLLRFSGSAYRLVSVSQFGGKLFVCLIDLAGNTHLRLDYSIEGIGAEGVIGLMREGIGRICCLPEAGRVIAVGVSLSAMVLDNGRRVVSSALGMDMIDLRNQLEDSLDAPLYISNNTFTKAMWLCRRVETCASGRTLYIELEKGVGAALLVDGVRLPMVLGEIGHTIVAPNGERCSCGKRGCLEAMCAPEQLLRRCGAGSMRAMNALLAAGDAGAQRAVDECAAYLGISLAGLVNLFNPDSILINMADFAECSAVVERACAIMRQNTLRGLDAGMRVFTTCFNPDETNYAIARELCDMLFAEDADSDVFERIEAKAALC